MCDLSRPILSLLAVALLAGVGCTSLSDSSASISEIISSPITSLSESSGSSSPDDETTAAIAELTFAHASGGGAPEALLVEVSRVAAERGIADWEAHEPTWIGIGRGLRSAGLDEAAMRAYADALTDDAGRRGWVRAGFVA